MHGAPASLVPVFQLAQLFKILKNHDQLFNLFRLSERLKVFSNDCMNEEFKEVL